MNAIYAKDFGGKECQGANPRDAPETVPQETLGHIQSAYCLGQQEVVTEAHNRCRDFILSIAAKARGNVIASGQPEADTKTLWQNSVCLQQLGS